MPPQPAWHHLHQHGRNRCHTEVISHDRRQQIIAAAAQQNKP
jgi:hypothetical protein